MAEYGERPKRSSENKSSEWAFMPCHPLVLMCLRMLSDVHKTCLQRHHSAIKQPSKPSTNTSIAKHHCLPKSVLINPLNPELNPICYLLALLGAHHFLHVSRIRVKLLTLRPLMSYIYIYIYIYGAPILDVSRSHTTTQHSR